MLQELLFLQEVMDRSPCPKLPKNTSRNRSSRESDEHDRAAEANANGHGFKPV